MEQLNLLGCQATDKVTNFTGVIVSVSFDLVGCIQAYVRPPMNKEGKLEDGCWMDVSRLKIGKRVMEGAFGEGKLVKNIGPSEKSAPRQ